MVAFGKKLKERQIQEWSGYGYFPSGFYMFLFAVVDSVSMNLHCCNDCGRNRRMLVFGLLRFP